MSIIYENFPSRVCHSRLVLAQNEKIDDNLVCGICQEIVFKPEECVTCQNVFCGECVQKWREKKNICPMTCPAPFKTVGPHKLLRKALGDLKYKCSFAETGCPCIISYENLFNHEKNCDFEKIKCPIDSFLCSVELLRKDQEEHKKVCEFQRISCEKCFFEIKKIDLEKHDCIKLLTSKYKEVIIEFSEYKQKIDEKILILTKKIDDLTQAKEEKNKNILDRYCKQGHVLAWSNGVDLDICFSCKKTKIFSRFFCSKCNHGYCIYCIPPILRNHTCPVGHILIKRSFLGFHSCDLCRKDLGKEENIYQDKACDFDVCGACLEKNK